MDPAALSAKLALARNQSDGEIVVSPPLARRALEAVEEKIGVPLPDDYARYLVDVANGGSGPPAYGLYSLAEAIAESEKGIYSLAEPFEPPLTEDDHVDLEAPGMLLLGHQGCGYWDGLVVAGPDAGTVWTFVEVRPGWIPVMEEGTLARADGSPFVWKQDYAEYYGVVLHPVNRARRLRFARYYERWLDQLVGADASGQVLQ